MEQHPASKLLRTFYVACGAQEHKLVTLLELLTALVLQRQAGQRLSALVVCRSRDVLDSIVCGLQDNSLFNVFALHSDLMDKERDFQLSRYQQHQQAAPPDPGGGPGDGASAAVPQQRSGSVDAPAGAPLTGTSPGGGGGGALASRPSASGRAAGVLESRGSGHQQQQQQQQVVQDQSCAVLVTTDVCLRAVPKGLQPVGASLLIQYDLPSTKEQLQRRVSTVFGGGRERRNARPIVIDFVVAGEVAQFRAVEKFTSPAAILEMPVHVGDVLVDG